MPRGHRMQASLFRNLVIYVVLSFAPLSGQAQDVSKTDHPAYGKRSNAEVSPQTGIPRDNKPSNQSGPQRQHSPQTVPPPGFYWDTLAQWAMAITSAIAVGLIWGTFRQSQRTLSEAQRSANAAEASVQVTRDSAQRQLRAYINVTDANVQFDPENFIIHIYIEIKNTGQTPAKNMRHSGAHSIGAKPEFFTPASKTSDPTIDVGSNVKMNFSDKTNIVSRARFNGVFQKSIPFYAFGAIYYNDVFGTRHLTKYRLYLDDENRLLPCAEGNEST